MGNYFFWQKVLEASFTLPNSWGLPTWPPEGVLHHLKTVSENWCCQFELFLSDALKHIHIGEMAITTTAFCCEPPSGLMGAVGGWVPCSGGNTSWVTLEGGERAIPSFSQLLRGFKPAISRSHPSLVWLYITRLEPPHPGCKKISTKDSYLWSSEKQHSPSAVQREVKWTGCRGL